MRTDMIKVDALAQEIRRVDGSHSLGAGALAEALMPFLADALASQKPAASAISVQDPMMILAGIKQFGLAADGSDLRDLAAAIERLASPIEPASPVVEATTLIEWPEAVSDGLSLPCSDCGLMPRFDYRVTDEFWNLHVGGAARLGVVCLPCMDRRCGGDGLADAITEVQWTGTQHTVVLKPTLRHIYPLTDTSSPVVPVAAKADAEGWRLVPVEPTPEMLGAWYRYKNGHRWPGEEPATDTSDVGAYRAMLAASPTGKGDGQP